MQYQQPSQSTERPRWWRSSRLLSCCVAGTSHTQDFEDSYETHFPDIAGPAPDEEEVSPSAPVVRLQTPVGSTIEVEPVDDQPQNDTLSDSGSTADSVPVATGATRRFLSNNSTNASVLSDIPSTSWKAQNGQISSAVPRCLDISSAEQQHLSLLNAVLEQQHCYSPCHSRSLSVHQLSAAGSERHFVPSTAQGADQQASWKQLPPQLLKMKSLEPRRSCSPAGTGGQEGQPSLRFPAMATRSSSFTAIGLHASRSNNSSLPAGRRTPPPSAAGTATGSPLPAALTPSKCCSMSSAASPSQQQRQQSELQRLLLASPAGSFTTPGVAYAPLKRTLSNATQATVMGLLPVVTPEARAAPSPIAPLSPVLSTMGSAVTADGPAGVTFVTLRRTFTPPPIQPVHLSDDITSERTAAAVADAAEAVAAAAEEIASSCSVGMLPTPFISSLHQKVVAAEVLAEQATAAAGAASTTPAAALQDCSAQTHLLDHTQLPALPKLKLAADTGNSWHQQQQQHHQQGPAAVMGAGDHHAVQLSALLTPRAARQETNMVTNLQGPGSSRTEHLPLVRPSQLQSSSPRVVGGPAAAACPPAAAVAGRTVAAATAAADNGPVFQTPSVSNSRRSSGSAGGGNRLLPQQHTMPSAGSKAGNAAATGWAGVGGRGLLGSISAPNLAANTPRGMMGQLHQVATAQGVGGVQGADVWDVLPVVPLSPLHMPRSSFTGTASANILDDSPAPPSPRLSVVGNSYSVINSMLSDKGLPLVPTSSVLEDSGGSEFVMNFGKRNQVPVVNNRQQSQGSEAAPGAAVPISTAPSAAMITTGPGSRPTAESAVPAATVVSEVVSAAVQPVERGPGDQAVMLTVTLNRPDPAGDACPTEGAADVSSKSSAVAMAARRLSSHAGLADAPFSPMKTDEGSEGVERVFAVLHDSKGLKDQGGDCWAGRPMGPDRQLPSGTSGKTDDTSSSRAAGSEGRLFSRRGWAAMLGHKQQQGSRRG